MAIELAAAFSMAAVILFAADWSVFVALKFERPIWRRVPPTLYLAWFLGHAVLGVGLTAAIGLILGLVAGAAMRVLSAG